MISVLLFTEGLVNEVLSRNSFKTPVFSNFFLKRLRALSIDSFSLMLIISMFYYLGCKYILFGSNFQRITSKLLWKSPISEFQRFLPRWCTISRLDRTSPLGNP